MIETPYYPDQFEQACAHEDAHEDAEYLKQRNADLEEALAGLRDLCEQAGMPCDRANALLAGRNTEARK